MINFFEKFFVPSKDEQNIVVLDIRDSSVGGAVVSFDKKLKIRPKKLFSEKRNIIFQKNFSFKRLFYSTSQAVSSVAFSIFKNNHIPIDKIYCVLGPHLYISQTKIIRAKYNESILVSQELLDKIVEGGLSRPAKGELKIFSGIDEHMEVLDKKIMQVKLNGYETPEPFHKKATEIEISVFVSYIPRLVMRDINKILSSSFHDRSIIYHSSAFVAADVLRGLHEEQDSFMFVSIGNELTEISVVKKGVIEEVSSIPKGRNLIFRDICEKFGTIYEESVSLVDMFTSNSSDPVLTEKLRESIKKSEEVWAGLFYKTLQKISSRHFLPDNLYLTAEKKCSGIFFDFVSKLDISNLLALNKPPRINCLDNEIFEIYCQNNSSCPDNIHLLIDSIFVNKLLLD